MFILLSIVIVPVSLYLTWNLLGGMFESFGRPKPVMQQKTSDMAIEEQVDAYVRERMESARGALLSQERPEEAPTETIPPVRKVYWIDDDAQVAPEPDQSLFGQTDDPASLQDILDQAAYLLDGQQLYFRTDVELFQNTPVRYYLDDSIFAITWKEVHEGSVYTFSEVKVSHPSQFRRHLAGGEFGSEMQYLTTEMAASVNAVVASSGDFYRFRDFGICVYEGKVRRVEGTYAETCYIDGNGDMHFTYGGDLLDTPSAQAYVDGNDIRFSLCFGPVLVDEYQVVNHTWYGVGEINEGYARAALCQMGPLHYIVVTANTEGPYQDIPTVATFSKYVSATGCRMAYCLDGGQTAAIVMNDELINRPVYGQQRKISDIIYFATAIPEGD
ncbi:MAG: phosphodiester glycosidase family protein [Candidatus Faecousia sp.]|nr:phosphodiester glycosidase family protein [Candidatus Faecousia sp.]